MSPDQNVWPLSDATDPVAVNNPNAWDTYVLCWTGKTILLAFVSDLVVEAIQYDATFAGVQSAPAPEFLVSPPWWLGPVRSFVKTRYFLWAFRYSIAAMFFACSTMCLSALFQFIFVIAPELPLLLARRMAWFAFAPDSALGRFQDRLVKTGKYCKNAVGVYSEPWAVPNMLTYSSFAPLPGTTSVWGGFWPQSTWYAVRRLSDCAAQTLRIPPDFREYSDRAVSTLVAALFCYGVASQTSRGKDAWEGVLVPFMWYFIGTFIVDGVLKVVIGMRITLAKKVIYGGLARYYLISCLMKRLMQHAMDCGFFVNLQNIGLIRLFGIEPKSPGLLSTLTTETVYWAPESVFVLTGLAI